MTRPRSGSALFLGLFLMSSLVAGCGGEPSSPAANGLENTKTKIATPPMVHDTPPYLAKGRPFEHAG